MKCCFSGDIMNSKKRTFSISFSFSYLSLFVDTPGSSGQRSRGSPCPAVPGDSACTAGLYSLLPQPAQHFSPLNFHLSLVSVRVELTRLHSHHRAIYSIILNERNESKGLHTCFLYCISLPCRFFDSLRSFRMTFWGLSPSL